MLSRFVYSNVISLPAGLSICKVIVAAVILDAECWDITKLITTVGCYSLCSTSGSEDYLKVFGLV
jgi:hypothetical protein